MTQNNAHNPDADQRLRAMLVEDTGSEAEADALLPTVQRLRRWSVPATQTSADLLTRLSAEMLVSRRSKWRAAWEWWPLLLIRSQAQVIRAEIWLASALVIALGTLVTLAGSGASMGGLLPLSVLAPVVAAVGVALLYDSDVELILELEDATRASARILLLARLSLVFSFDLLLTLTASVILSLAHAEISLWPLVMSWLAPMAFLTGLAFFLSVALVDSLAGSLFSLAIWAAHVVLRTAASDNQWVRLVSMPGLDSPSFRPLLLTVAALLVGVALWLAGRTERKIGDVG